MYTYSIVGGFSKFSDPCGGNFRLKVNWKNVIVKLEQKFIKYVIVI